MNDIFFFTTSYAITGGLIHYYVQDIFVSYTLGRPDNYTSILNSGFFIGAGLGIIKGYYLYNN